MNNYLKIIFLFTVGTVFSQNINSENIPNVKIDSLYREDQFYFSFTYNTLQKKPDGLTQSKFSKGFSLGFLRDMPINKMRTIAITTGIGITFNNLNQNILISKTNQTTTYALIDSDISYQKNRISQLLIDVPIEFRWRSSTFESHKFWRIYGGAKFSYLVNDRSIYDDYQDKTIVNNNPDFRKLNYGVYVAAGYNTINLYGYYGLNSIFKSAKIGSESIDMNSLNIGVIFYIL